MSRAACAGTTRIAPASPMQGFASAIGHGRVGALVARSEKGLVMPPMREKLYEYALRFTSVVDYGVKLEDILAGKAAPPPQGARIDIWFEGQVTGRLAGRIRGVDYLTVRADGRLDLIIRAEITTPDGSKIALAATGVGAPEPGSPLAQLRENVQLTTAYGDYAWVNKPQIWAAGTVDLAAGTVQAEAYVA